MTQGSNLDPQLARVGSEQNSTFAGPRFWTLLALVFGAAALRLVPHIPNFTPITGLALFGGAFMEGPRGQRKLWAVLLPLLALVLSDAVIGFYSILPVVYFSFALIAVIGFTLREHHSAARVAGVTVASSFLFFALTNFGEWALTDFYPHTSAGLLACYVAALPFLRNAVLGDLVYTGAFFMVWLGLRNAVPKLREA